jgi:hypothetical protein
LVYCFEEPDNKRPMGEIGVPASLAFAARSTDSLGGVIELVSEGGQGEPVVAIPYYAWSNRGVSSMAVWVAAR